MDASTTRSRSDDVDIPTATCYRPIEELVDAGLLTCDGHRFSEEGRQTNVYRRTVDEPEVELSLEGPTCSRERRSSARVRLQERLEGEP